MEQIFDKCYTIDYRLNIKIVTKLEKDQKIRLKLNSIFNTS